MANIFTGLLAYTDPALPGPIVGAADSNVKNYFQYMRDTNGKALSAAMTAADAVIKHATHLTTTSGGNYTLTVNATANGITYTTASLAHNATAATIEAALDTASPATVGDGDITVAEEGSAGLSDGYCTFTCDGNLAEVPVLITSTDVDLSGSGNGLGAITYTTEGRMNRYATQAIAELNIALGALDHQSGTAPTLTTAAANYIGWVDRASLAVIRWLGLACTVEDGTTDMQDALEVLYPELLTPA